MAQLIWSLGDEEKRVMTLAPVVNFINILRLLLTAIAKKLYATMHTAIH